MLCVVHWAHPSINPSQVPSLGAFGRQLAFLAARHRAAGKVLEGVSLWIIGWGK